MSAITGNSKSPRTHIEYGDAARRSVELERAARLRGLSEEMRDLIRRVNEPEFNRWRDQVRQIGGCAHPVYLSGRTVTYDAVSGEIRHAYSTSGEPGGRLAVRCRNRRASACEPCSRLHSGDTFHLVRSGLSGGKGVSDLVCRHPRLFVTLTAPSFGSVHRLTSDGSPCRPRRDHPVCQHGERLGCGLVHSPDDPLVGLPLCAACYDYVGHVLWHAHVGRLWDRFTTSVRRGLASSAGIPRTRLRHHLVVSFAKIAEFQPRAAVHFHAVVRLDGPEGPQSAPPAWATAELLTETVQRAARAVSVVVPESDAYGTDHLGWGVQLDVQPVRSFAEGSELSDSAVAGYVAKYVTKSAADSAAGLDHPVHSLGEIRTAPVSTHLRALMATCWRLGGLPELEHLRLRPWAHSLGYRGHILTKSRRYSTTYTALRAERTEHTRGPSAQVHGPGTVTESTWRYAGSGYSPGEAWLAHGIAGGIAAAREAAREFRRGAC